MSSTRSTRATRQSNQTTSEADPTSSNHQSHSDYQPQQNESQEEEMDQLNSENGENHQNGQLDSNQTNHVSTSQPNFQNHNSNSNPAQSATVPSSSSHPNSHQNHHYAPPLGTLEPSAERYHSQAGNGRRGSTDPVLHASIAAAASANVAANGGDKTDKRGLLNNFTYEDPANYYNPNYAPPGQHQYNLYNLQGPPMPHPMMHAQQQQNQLMQQRQQEQQQQHQHQHQHHPSNPNPNPPQNGPRPQFQQMGPATYSPPGIPTEQSYGGEGSGKRKKGPIGAQPGTNNQPNLGRKETPYSRSPDMRVTHASAERKRRSDMKELFDELRGLLPTDKGPKSSKWEILSKAVDALKSDRQQVESLTAENEQLRTELAAYRGTDNGYATHHQEGIDGTGYQDQDQQDPNASYPTS